MTDPNLIISLERIAEDFHNFSLVVCFLGGAIVGTLLLIYWKK